MNELRGEVVSLTARVDAVEVRVAAVEQAVDAVGERIVSLEQVTREGFIRVSTELVALHGTMRDIRDHLVLYRGDRERLDDHERRLAELENKVG